MSDKPEIGMTYNSCTFTMFFPNEKQTIECSPCFRNLPKYGAGIPDRIEYYTVIPSVLKAGALNHFIYFLQECLDATKFTHIIDAEEGKITWILNSKGMSREQALLYLSLFRYANEKPFPEFLNYFFQETAGTDAENLFTFFQKAHFACNDYSFPMPPDYQKIKREYDDLLEYGHTVMNFYGQKTHIPVPLSEFKEFLRANKLSRVTDYFQKSR